MQLARFKSPTVEITVKLPDALLQTKFKAANVRTLLTLKLPHSAVVKKSDLLGAIDRILFLNGLNYQKTWGTLTFSGNQLVVNDFGNECNDTMDFSGPALDEPYVAGVFLDNFKSLVEGSTDDKVEIQFGNNKMVIVKKPSLPNVLEAMPESRNYTA